MGVLGFSFASQPAQATAIEPTIVPDNPSCPPGTIQLKIEPVADGTYSDGTFSVTIDVYDTANGQVFDFTANMGVSSLAKGADGNLYVYDPEVTSDTGLHHRLIRRTTCTTG